MFRVWDKARGHSIREAVFMLKLSVPIAPGSIDQIAEHGKANFIRLPRVEKNLSVQFNLDMSPMPMQFPGVTFSRFKENGDILWRVVVIGNDITVNCLDYTSWEDVSNEALSYMGEIVGIVSPGAMVSSVGLQYINAFVADSLGEDSINSLLRKESPKIPSSFWDIESTEWHLHTGYFSAASGDIAGRILSRYHLTSQIEDGRDNVVLLDLLQSYHFSVGQPFIAAIELSENSPFSEMRVLVRRALRDYLATDVCDMIGAKEL